MTTTEQDREKMAEAAMTAAAELRQSVPAERAQWMESVADALEDARKQLVRTAQAETHLPDARLNGELTRTTFQLRLFAEVLRDGSFLDARIDRADPDWGMGPRPDLRRVKQPRGPVLIFAASNFPFAFSVAGGDAASALAAGCPVVVKAHEGHPELSRQTAQVVASALVRAGAPGNTFALIEGRDAGVAMLKDPRISAGGFTGSIAGGRALFDIATSRPVPIPFYAEMGSVNPVVITAAAVEARASEIAQELVGSMTMGVGQFCTKPGLVFVPQGIGFEDEVRAVSLPSADPMLTEGITEAYRRGAAELAAHAGVEVLTGGEDPLDPVVFLTDLDHAQADEEALMAECFGPSTLLIRYKSLSDVAALLSGIEGQLTGTLIGEEGEELGGLVDILAERTGRVLWNSWPTGVTVTYAQQHGGPYPATTADGSTSVGTAAIERYQRAVAYQGMPESLLPPALRDANPWGVPQTIR